MMQKNMLVPKASRHPAGMGCDREKKNVMQIPEASKHIPGRGLQKGRCKRKKNYLQTLKFLDILQAWVASKEGLCQQKIK